MLLVPVVLVVCLAAPQVVTASHGARTVPPPPLGPKDAAEAGSRCCGPTSALPPKPPLGHPGPERCCGQGWGLHCCIGAACCLGDVVVPNVVVPHGLPQPAPATPSGSGKPRALYGSSPWWKNWAQWLNLGIVLVVVALVGGLLTCCCHRVRRDKAFVRQQRLLGDSGLYNYGAAGANPSAPHWNTPLTSRWVDFSYKQPLKNHTSPPYRQGPTVRPRPSDSDTEANVSPIFSSSDEEYKLVNEFKLKTKWPD